MGHSVYLDGYFFLICRNADGSLAWSERCKNGITSAGLNYILAAGLTGGSQITTWHMGLIDLTGFTGLAAADTMALHDGWDEFTGYSQAARPTWSGATGGQLSSNSAPCTFTMTSAGTLHGIFMNSVNTKGGTTGTLWCTALFNTDRVVAVGQSVTVIYICSAAGA